MAFNVPTAEISQAGRLWLSGDKGFFFIMNNCRGVSYWSDKKNDERIFYTAGSDSVSKGLNTHFCFPVAASKANNFICAEVPNRMPLTIMGLHCIFDKLAVTASSV
jgi:hypothetical protein